MTEEKPYVRVNYSNDDRGNLLNCRDSYIPVLVVNGIKMIPIEDWKSLSKEEGNSLAKKIAEGLGIEARLNE